MVGSRMRSPVLVALAALVALQGVALLAVAVFYAAELARDQAVDPRGALFAGLVALIVALGLLACARGLIRGRRWARSPVLVVQLLLALVAVGPDGVVHGSPYVGVGLVLWAVIVATLLFVPGVSAVLEE